MILEIIQAEVSLYVCMHACMYVRVFMYIYMCIYMYINISCITVMCVASELGASFLQSQREAAVQTSLFADISLELSGGFKAQRGDSSSNLVEVERPFTEVHRGAGSCACFGRAAGWGQILGAEIAANLHRDSSSAAVWSCSGAAGKILGTTVSHESSVPSTMAPCSYIDQCPERR